MTRNKKIIYKILIICVFGVLMFVAGFFAGNQMCPAPITDTPLSYPGYDYKIWNYYGNPQLGFSIQIPKEVNGLYKCPSKETIQVPVKVFEDNKNGVVYISQEYYYKAEWDSELREFIGPCEKITYSLELLRNETEESYANMFFLGWAVLIKSVKDENELDEFIKQNYGSGCFAGDKKSWEQDGVYEITIGGWDEWEDLGTTDCPVNYIYKVLYAPEKNKVMLVKLGQECTFRTNSYLVSYNCYDQEMINSFKFETAEEKPQPVLEEPIEVVEKFIEADMAGARLGGEIAKEAPDIKKYYTFSSGFPTGFAYEGDLAMVIKKYEIIDEYPSENESSYFVKVKYFCEQGIASGFTEGAKNIETGEEISIEEMGNGSGLVGFDCDYFYNPLIDSSIIEYDSKTQTETITFELIKDKGQWKLNSPSICPRISEETLKKHLETL